MPKKIKASIESEELEEELEDELEDEIVLDEPIKISKKTGKPIKKLSTKQLENLQLGRERGLVMKNLIKENTDITKTTEYIKKARNLKNNKIEENNILLKKELKEIIKEPIRKSIKKKKKKYIQIECTDSEESESDGIVIKKELIVTPIIEDPFIAERLLKQKLYNDRVDAITKFMLNKNK
jgi:hypothetical protein